MNIIFLLWWWIPTIVSAGTVHGKKPVIVNTRFSEDQPQIQPKYQPQAAATSPAKSNGDNSEFPLDKQSEPQIVASIHGISDVTNLDSIPGKRSAPQETTTIHGITEVTKLNSTSGKRSAPEETTTIHGITEVTKLNSTSGKRSAPEETTTIHGITEVTKLNSTSGKRSAPEETTKIHGITEVTNSNSTPGKRSVPEETTTIHGITEVTNLDPTPGKRSAQEEAISIHGNSDLINLEIGAGNQVGAGGSALSPDIGENVAPADERPSRTQIQQGAPAPVAQPPPPPPTVQPPGDDNLNKTKNGTSKSTNSTTKLPDMEGDIKQGAKGKSLAELSQNQDLMNIKTNLEIMGSSNQEYSCDGNRGPLRPMYHRSKYFVDMVHRYTYEEGRTLCNKYELIFAEIDSMSDFKSVQLFYDTQYTTSAFNASTDRYFIGLNDLEEEGVYKRADGTNITFQAYFTTQPDDKDGIEDCTAVGKDAFVDPMGMMDVSCMSKYHVLCMFPGEDTCINDTRESNLFYTWMKHVGVHSLMDMTERAYSVSNFQLTWEKAFDYCLSQSMKIFDMDHIVNKFFFRTLYQYETKMATETVPVIQYWTAGRFKQSHMKAEVYWENEESVHPTIEDEDKRPKQNFTFSGIFRWNNYKGADPTARLGTRKDLCLTFGFQLKPEDTPFVRNTNCGLPCYFVCAKDHAPKFEEPSQEDEK